MCIEKYTEADLIGFLSEMGLDGSETLMVHSSMKSIGQVEGGADTVLDALFKYFSKGLLVFPAFSYATVAFPFNMRFDKDKSPSCTGILTELFRQRPGVCRSLHPQHSVTAAGRDADEFVAGHYKCHSGFSKNGPFGRLLERKGKILLIGVGLNRVSLIHAIIEWSGAPVCAKEPQVFSLVDSDGKIYEAKNHYHLGSQWEFFPRALPLLEAGNAVKKVKFGDAQSLLLDVEKTVEILDAVLKKDYHFFYNPDCPAEIQMP